MYLYLCICVKYLAGVTYSAPPDPLAGFQGLYFKGEMSGGEKEQRERKDKEVGDGKDRAERRVKEGASSLFAGASAVDCGWRRGWPLCGLQKLESS